MINEPEAEVIRQIFQMYLDGYSVEEIDTFIEAVETSLYNIKQEKISGDNVYQFLLFFDNLYDRFTDMEKKIFMKRFLEEGNIYEAEQEDGRILRSLKFRFSVFFNEQELYELDWDNESTVESVLLMRRARSFSSNSTLSPQPPYVLYYYTTFLLVFQYGQLPADI